MISSGTMDVAIPRQRAHWVALNIACTIHNALMNDLSSLNSPILSSILQSIS